MRPQNLTTKIFLDSGDPNETKEAIKLLGFLDGQTTNPSLIAKSPEAQEKLARGEKFSSEEVYAFYKKVVQEVSGLIPFGSVSIEVYADANTKAEDMLAQAREFYQWIPNAHIKFPTTTEGVKAAQAALEEGIWVNMTLVFSQAQAAAIFSATQGAQRGDVFISPFVGRLDDRGENGMDLIKNMVEIYKDTDHHVQVLTASVRSLDHFMEAMRLGSDIITTPFKILKEWAELGMPSSSDKSQAASSKLKPIELETFDLSKPWQDFNIQHELTDKGIEKFAQDWNNLIA